MIQDLVNGLVSWSEQFIVPDWGQLVALIPLGLAALVFLYVTWTVYRFATAGPTRRGRQRLAPVAPGGIHMPGPSFAPLLAATGAFFLVFGMVANGIWLAVGAVILVITLLYWGREEMRNFDRATAGGHGGAAAGALPAMVGALQAPAGVPPAGVHIPPPSFRPLLMSVAATMLVAGLVVGGWAMILGFLAVVVTGLGWLRDARREYAATEAADATGHLDLGGAPAWPKATFAVLAMLVAFALLLSSGLIGGGSSGGTATASAAPGASAPAGGAPGSAAPASAAPKADVVVTAKGTAWVESDVKIPGGKPFKLAFDNQDTMPHNVTIHDASGAVVFHTDTITGPLLKVYDVPAIPAGQYTFVCTVHANMTGTVTAS